MNTLQPLNIQRFIIFHFLQELSACFTDFFEDASSSSRCRSRLMDIWTFSIFSALSNSYCVCKWRSRSSSKLLFKISLPQVIPNLGINFFEKVEIIRILHVLSF